jgi:glutamate racemase
MEKNNILGIDFAFLDSGTGGIPYMRYLKDKCPSASCIYLGDTAHFPYGEKTSEQVTECASAAIEKIISHFNPGTIVVACNTISVTALTELRVRFPKIPFVGTVPAIRLAARVTKNKNIGLLATNATVNHPYSAKLIKDFASECHVYSRGDADLVSFIEHKLFTATPEERRNAVLPAVNYFVENNVDTIILGCTHFIHMADDILKVAQEISPLGKEVQVVDSREGVANQALRVEGKTFGEQKNGIPSQKEMPLYVTGFKSPADENEYRTLCVRNNLLWSGIL